MVKACSYSTDSFRWINALLFDNRSFVEFIVDELEQPLQYMLHHAQLRFPDLVVKSFAASNSLTGVSLSEAYFMKRLVSPDLWSNRDVVRDWFRAGLPFLGRNEFPADSKNDSEIFFLVAEYCCWHHRSGSLQQFSGSLRGNKDVMLQAMELCGNYLEHALRSLWGDFDIVVTAFTQWSEWDFGDGFALEHPLREYYRDQPNILRTVKAEIQQKLQAHEAFTKQILPGMKFGGETSSLSLLNQGAETSEVYKRSIADFLDVPRGKELQLLRNPRNALTNSCLALVLERYEWLW